MTGLIYTNKFITIHCYNLKITDIFIPISTDFYSNRLFPVKKEEIIVFPEKVLQTDIF